MVVEREPGGTSLIDVLDRILDKGIVMDAWTRVSFAGIDLMTFDTRMVVASIDTYLRYGERRSLARLLRPGLAGASWKSESAKSDSTGDSAATGSGDAARAAPADAARVRGAPLEEHRHPPPSASERAGRKMK